MTMCRILGTMGDGNTRNSDALRPGIFREDKLSRGNPGIRKTCEFASMKKLHNYSLKHKYS